MATDRHAFAFNKFGGLRLDQPIDEIGGEAAQYLRDVDWDGTVGKIRPRDGFQKLNTTDASGPYKALFAHSSTRLLATKRVAEEKLKLVAIDREGEEKAEVGEYELDPGLSCFARFGTPSASYTYWRIDVPKAGVVRFDGSEFTAPTCSVDGVTGKSLPLGKIMLAWPDGGNRFITLNTGATGGPGGAASSESHGWFSEPGDAEGYESTAYVQFSPGDGEEITAGAVFGAQVFVFKETKFFVVYGVEVDEEGRPIFAFREVSLGEGSRMKAPNISALAETSDQLACTSANGVYFCTSDGVWLTTGSTPVKVSQALRPLEEISPFDGPMAEFLNGETEAFRWPASGIVSLGSRIVVKRYEFMFVLDIPTGEWTCWKMPAVSMCAWTGLSGGGADAIGKNPTTAADNDATGTVEWENSEGALTTDEEWASATGPSDQAEHHSHYLQFSDLDFSAIPEGSVVTGIVLWVERKAIGFVADEVVLLGRGGGGVGENRAIGTGGSSGGGGVTIGGGFWPGSPTPVAYGGPTDLWGTTWTLDQIAELEVFLSVKMAAAYQFPFAQAFVGGIGVSVYYVAPDAASGVRPRLFCTQAKSVFFTQPGATDDAETCQAEWQSGLYDLGNDDEKTIVEDKLWGQGAVDLTAYSDFSTQPDTGYPESLEMPAAPMIGQARSHKSQPSATFFSHKLSLEPGSQVQSITRYVREGRVPTTKTK